jgi:hypothetical protein
MGEQYLIHLHNVILQMQNINKLSDSPLVKCPSFVLMNGLAYNTIIP